MPQPQHTAAGAAAGHPVRSAPYALVRATVLAHPAQSPDAAEFRRLAAQLHRIDAELTHLVEPLCDALHDSRSGHPEDFHRDVVLPLRRALHNGREPRPALLDRLGDLPARLPALAAWTALRSRRALLLGRLDAATERALTAERAQLAALCREPALAKAVASTSVDLLRAVERAATGATDRRSRKEEPAVLRYALRASTKTSPLSWFTAVAWGPLTERPAGPAVPDWGAAPQLPGPLHSVVKVNRTLTAALTVALLDSPHRRTALPHRITSTARVAEGRAAYSRDRTAFAGGRYLVAGEDEAELAHAGPLGLLTGRAAEPVALDALAEVLAGALSGRGSGTGDGDPQGMATAAAGYLARLVEAGLLVPADPVPPQDDDPLRSLADWLRTFGATHPEDAARADRLDDLRRLTAAFAEAPATARPALLADLSRRWRAELADAGRPVPPVSAPLTVLTEDVVAPDPLVLDGFLDAADHEALGEITALAELFDLGHLVRRVVRDRFVARYGRGGTCRHPWEFGPEVTEAWDAAARLPVLDPRDGTPLPGGAAELLALRSAVIDAVRETAAAAPAGAPELVLPPDVLKTLGAQLPGWTLERPLGYAYFLQRDPRHGLLCVNHVYGGWGRFSSRFLDALDPGARAAVARQIGRGIDPGARVAQIRPVGGFNANLHPLLVPDEIGTDRRTTSLTESDLELVHDLTTDQVRFRLRDTGELLDVLYSGFLAPVLLPRRLGAHLNDHPQGTVDFRPLIPRTQLPAPGGTVTRSPRLRHRHVVLRRARWVLPPDSVRALRAELAAASNPAEPAARWRALLDLPEQLFLHPAAPTPTGRGAEDFLSRLSRPKPQFVDLGNALHLRCLAKWLVRHEGGAVLEEALPASGGLASPARAVELVLEVNRPGRPR
ncbi:lantibiotic dehydratase [Streptomyces sp. NPDC001568]|uniref:lantibiotic dehydratase n=1 Tax=Streptomyces sp. NPDC001568 TaxID=3364588 RepID=UPI0036925ADB